MDRAGLGCRRGCRSASTAVRGPGLRHHRAIRQRPPPPIASMRRIVATRIVAPRHTSGDAICSRTAPLRNAELRPTLPIARIAATSVLPHPRRPEQAPRRRLDDERAHPGEDHRDPEPLRVARRRPHHREDDQRARQRERRDDRERRLARPERRASHGQGVEERERPILPLARERRRADGEGVQARPEQRQGRQHAGPRVVPPVPQREPLHQHGHQARAPPSRARTPAPLSTTIVRASTAPGRARLRRLETRYPRFVAPEGRPSVARGDSPWEDRRSRLPEHFP